MMYFTNFPLDKVHAQRRKAETAWSQRNYKNALQHFQGAVDGLKEVLRLDVVRNDASLFRILECQLNDLQQKVRHCGIYVSRSDHSEPSDSWEAGAAKTSSVDSDASVRLETVQTVWNYDFACDTLLSGLSTGSKRQCPQLPSSARKRPKELEETIEELRITVAQKRRDLRHHVDELRKAKEKLSQNRNLRDFLRDRQSIREEKYDLTTPPATSRLRHLAGQRGNGEEQGKGEAAIPPRLSSPGNHRPESAPPGGNDPSLCTLIENRLLREFSDDLSTLGTTLSWARVSKGGNNSLLSEKVELTRSLEQLQADLVKVTRERNDCEKECFELEAEIGELRHLLNLPSAVPPLPEVTNSDSDPENCALLPLSLPPAFNLPQNLLPSGPLLLEE